MAQNELEELLKGEWGEFTVLSIQKKRPMGWIYLHQILLNKEQIVAKETTVEEIVKSIRNQYEKIDIPNDCITAQNYCEQHLTPQQRHKLKLPSKKKSNLDHDFKTLVQTRRWRSISKRFSRQPQHTPLFLACVAGITTNKVQSSRNHLNIFGEWDRLEEIYDTSDENTQQQMIAMSKKLIQDTLTKKQAQTIGVPTGWMDEHIDIEVSSAFINVLAWLGNDDNTNNNINGEYCMCYTHFCGKLVKVEIVL